MKVESVTNFNNYNFQVNKISRPVEVLSDEEIKFFENLFPESVEGIRKYCQYNSQSELVFETDHVINKKV
ncbi:MAG: hypothetical protein RMJ81_02225 [Candidatus Kryptonium sp.]|nr:hypothetical protein [Candidatus Kryptonium sp.]MDW8108454.1 hypothetical protein [Candidatus Kryptonium sp.]